MNKTWLDTLDSDVRVEVCMLAGVVNSRELHEYESLTHFLHDTANTISELKYLIKQAARRVK